MLVLMHRGSLTRITKNKTSAASLFGTNMTNMADKISTKPNSCDHEKLTVLKHDCFTETFGRKYSKPLNLKFIPCWNAVLCCRFTRDADITNFTLRYIFSSTSIITLLVGY